MSTSSPYRGITKLYGVSYKNKRIGQCTNRDGDACCPNCKNTANLHFDGEHVQAGFSFNKYMEFNHCSECGTHFCLVMQRKAEEHDAAYV